VGPCLLIKSDCSDFVKAEGFAQRHSHGALGAEARFASQHAALLRSAQPGGTELIFHLNPPCPRPCLRRTGRGWREKGRKDGSGRARAQE